MWRGRGAGRGGNKEVNRVQQAVIILLFVVQLAEAKKKADELQMELEELQGAKRRVDGELNTMQDSLDSLKDENNRVIKSKKKVQEEVSEMGEGLWVWSRPILSHLSCSLTMSMSTLSQPGA